MRNPARVSTVPVTLFLCLAASAWSTGLWAQERFSTVEERMTGREFTAAGLDKLSPQELAALNNWLRAHSVATLDSPRAGVSTVAPTDGAAAAARTDAAGDTRGFEKQATRDLPDDDIVAGIQGAFSGWRGDTVFRLDNGMVWKQAEGGTFYIPETDNATVVIEQGVFNSWRLKVEGYGKTVRVERLQ